MGSYHTNRICMLLSCFTYALGLSPYVNNVLTRMEASNACLDKNLSLPGIENSQESVIENMLLHNIETTWLGIYPKTWNHNHYIWLCGAEFVARLSPLDYKGPPKHCGILETTYSKIDDAVCTEQGIGYICELDDGRSCKSLSPYECLKVGNRYYRIYERTSSWFMARQLCRSIGGKLALLKSETIIQHLAAAIKQHHKDTKKYFIGFRRMDYFLGHHNSELLVETHHWYPGEPSISDGCIVIHRYPEGFYWKMVSCQDKYRVLCISNTETTSSKPVIRSSTFTPDFHLISTQKENDINDREVTNESSEKGDSTKKLLALIIITAILQVILIVQLMVSWVIKIRKRWRNKNAKSDNKETYLLTSKSGKPI